MFGLVSRFDYLQGTFYCPNRKIIERLLDILCKFIFPADKWYWLKHGIYSGEKFDNAFQSVSGKFRGGFRWESGECRGIIFIPGSFLSKLTEHKQYRLVSGLSRLGLKFTRVDIALDDYHRRIEHDWVKEAGHSGLYQFFDKFDYRASKIVRDSSAVPTCYFGSEKSDKRLRFYDADSVHQIGADRWELQLRREYADCAVDDYLKDPDCLASLVVGSIRFVKSFDVNWRHLESADWWQLLVNAVGTRRLHRLDVSSHPYDVIAWLERQVAPSLAVLYYGKGSEWFNDFIQDLVNQGFIRFQPKHTALVDWFINEGSASENDCSVR